MVLRAVTDTPLRAIALIRVSKVGDRGDDLISPDLQRNAIETRAAQLNARVVEWIDVTDESASQANSKWWARLDSAVESVEAGRVEMVLVWKFSRAARHRKRWAVALDRIEVAGGSLESATEQLDVSTSTGRLSRGILAELAAWESEVKGEQWKEAHARRYRMGLPHKTFKVFGFIWDGTAYIHDSETAPYVLRMYQDYATGTVGMLAIARHLIDRGVTGADGSVWTERKVARYLDSGWAAGFIPVGRASGNFRRLPGAHIPIVDADLWETYLRMRIEKRQEPAKRRYPKHYLSGLVVCSRCLKPMVTYPYRGRTGTYLRAYRCSLNQANRTCEGVHVMAHLVDAEVRRFLQPLAEEATPRAAHIAANEIAEARHADDTRMLSRELDALKVRNHRMIERLDQGVISDDDYLAWRQQRDIDISRLEEALHAARVQQELLRRGTSAAKEIGDVLARWDKLAAEAPADLKAWLAGYISRIVVHPHGHADRFQIVTRYDA